MKNTLLLLGGLLLATGSFAQNTNPKKDYLVTVKTDFGDVLLVLHNKTPLHKAQFLKLTQEQYFDSLLFHRVIDKFMIQGGDPTSKHAKTGQVLGNGGDEFTRVPAEFQPNLFHKKGALAAARDNNPEKASSACQFYIVHGKVWNEADLAKQMARSGRPQGFTDAQKEAYKTIGGSPHLDGNYTVFGQAIAGLHVIDSIATRPRDVNNRPLKDVRMRVSAELMRKKKITKKYGYVFE